MQNTKFYPIYLKQSTMETLTSWCCWICRQPSTRSTMTSCCSGLKVRSEFRVMYWPGFLHIYRVENSPFVSVLTPPALCRCRHLVFHRGSVLGPLLFILCTVDLIELIRSHDLCPHLNADDTQLYGSCRPGQVSSFDLVAGWMRSNQLFVPQIRLSTVSGTVCLLTLLPLIAFLSSGVA